MAKVSIEKVTEFSKFTALLDIIVANQLEYDNKFPTGMSKLDIVNWLIQLWGDGAIVYAEVYADGPLKFCSIIAIRDDVAYWHVLFSHKRYQYNTKKVIEEIKDELRARGVKTIISRTTRTTPSYKRFMASLGSYQSEIIYKCKL